MPDKKHFKISVSPDSSNQNERRVYDWLEKLEKRYPHVKRKDMVMLLVTLGLDSLEKASEFSLSMKNRENEEKESLEQSTDHHNSSHKAVVADDSANEQHVPVKIEEADVLKASNSSSSESNKESNDNKSDLDDDVIKKAMLKIEF